MGDQTKFGLTDLRKRPPMTPTRPASRRPGVAPEPFTIATAIPHKASMASQGNVKKVSRTSSSIHLDTIEALQ